MAHSRVRLRLKHFVWVALCEVVQVSSSVETSDRALSPVDAVARTAAAIAGRGDYCERVPALDGHDEMARLTRTVNAMLDQLEHTIECEKQFARIAVHELRTPLTVLKGRLELTLERPREAAGYPKVLSGMQGSVNHLIALSESLLALARTDAPVREVAMIGKAVACELGRLGYRAHYALAGDVLNRVVSSLAAITAAERDLVREYAYGQLGLMTGGWDA